MRGSGGRRSNNRGMIACLRRGGKRPVVPESSCRRCTAGAVWVLCRCFDTPYVLIVRQEGARGTEAEEDAVQRPPRRGDGAEVGGRNARQDGAVARRVDR